MQKSDDILSLEVPETRSSLISHLDYNRTDNELSVLLRYKKDKLIYEGFEYKHFQELLKQPSIGKFYLHFIKPNFKLKKTEFMAEERKVPTKNVASDKIRFIDISIDVRKVKKEWLFEGKNGTYLAMTLRMLPDGTIDEYGNLGMITQKVPQEIYKADKDTRGPILGNAAELDWETYKSLKMEMQPGTETGQMINPENVDELPF